MITALGGTLPPSLPSLRLMQKPAKTWRAFAGWCRILVEVHQPVTATAHHEQSGNTPQQEHRHGVLLW
jgi:hypothetical protein